MKKYLFSVLFLSLGLLIINPVSVFASEDLTITKTCSTTDCASPDSFPFSITGTNSSVNGSPSLDSSIGYTKTYTGFQSAVPDPGPQPTNTYTITENTPTGWGASTVACSTINSTASIVFDTSNIAETSAHITCTFTSTKLPVNGTWSVWSPSTSACGTGTFTQTRSCLGASNGGTCPSDADGVLTSKDTQKNACSQGPAVSFNTSNALAFISAQQNSDGSFASTTSTDWAAVAFGASDPGASKSRLTSYLSGARPVLSDTIDYERHAMALEALGIDPYVGTRVDYITPIINAFDGTQIGNPNSEVDDIFAIFPLTKAGYSSSDSIIKKEILYIISKQKANGSWGDDDKLTADAIQALGPFYMTPGYGRTMGMAMGYLASKQQTDGGWGDIESTSVVATMLNAMKESDPSRFVPLTSSTGLLHSDYIALAQQNDGGVLFADRILGTSHAVVAISTKSWLTILHSFSKPAPVVASGGGNVTSTPPSTPEVNVVPPLPALISIPGCDNSTIGFSSVNGQSCAKNLVKKEIVKVDNLLITPPTNLTPIKYNLGTKILRIGSKGEAVKELQRYLNSILNLGLVIDGKIGHKTISIIKKWQVSKGLVPDGLIGPKAKEIMK